MRFGANRGRRAVALLALTVVGVAASSLVAAPRASAATCWERVIGDWRDGHITGTYSPTCLRAALRNLPEDLRVYGSAEEDITQALTRAVEPRTSRVLAATATRTKRTSSTSTAEPTRKAGRSFAGRASSKTRRVAAAAPADDTGRTALASARTAIAGGALGLVALVLAAALWRTRRRRAGRML